MRGCSPAPRKPASSASTFRSPGLGGYNKQLGLNHFDLLIDWGWFYFITKPMFLALDFFFHLFGNFGVAILLVTVLVKLIFFPLANKSYASMAKMKAVQPQLAALKERYPGRQGEAAAGDDGDLQEGEDQSGRRLSSRSLLQIPVFFSLYKVLFVTIEMRHAPFFGWIKDLSAPDPTNLFNLFGLMPFDPTQLPVLGHYLALGVWPIIMGITMWFQMKLNPTPPDPTQKMIFDWMPLIFTFMLAGFPAGLVIYWAWNNTLSVLQQSYIMRKNGVKVELFDNVKSTFAQEGRPRRRDSSSSCVIARQRRVEGRAMSAASMRLRDVAGLPRIARNDDRKDLRMTTDTDAKLIEAGPQAVRRRLAVHLGLALDRNAAADGAASRSRSPAAPMSANPA